MSKLARKSVRARRKNPKKFQDHMERIAFKEGKARWQKMSGPSIIADYILKEAKLIIEVTYQLSKNAAKKYSPRTEFFESSTLPDTPTIVKQLKDMRKDFAENTVLISEHQRDDAYTLKGMGFRITQL